MKVAEQLQDLTWKVNIWSASPEITETKCSSSHSQNSDTENDHFNLLLSSVPIYLRPNLKLSSHLQLDALSAPVYLRVSG
jgi:hypothetical protein